MKQKQPAQASLIRLARRLMKDRINFPAVAEGGVYIERRVHAVGQVFQIVSMREAMFSGITETHCTFPIPIAIHRLESKENGMWMSDEPCELVQMWRDLAVYAHGNVLVGGLGLGILPRMLLRKANVTSITVVEKDPDVIRLIMPFLGNGFTCLNEDIFTFAKNIQPGEFDVALLDTWQDTGEYVWQSEVVPLRRLLASKVPLTYCWMEEVMLGQIRQGALRYAEMNSAKLYDRVNCHYYAFRRALIAEGLRSDSTAISSVTGFRQLIEAEQRNRTDYGLQRFLEKFLQTVGTPEWEWIFGRYWDEAWSSGPE